MRQAVSTKTSDRIRVAGFSPSKHIVLRSPDTRVALLDTCYYSMAKRIGRAVVQDSRKIGGEVSRPRELNTESALAVQLWCFKGRHTLVRCISGSHLMLTPAFAVRANHQAQPCSCCVSLRLA